MPAMTSTTRIHRSSRSSRPPRSRFRRRERSGRIGVSAIRLRSQPIGPSSSQPGRSNQAGIRRGTSAATVGACGRGRRRSGHGDRRRRGEGDVARAGSARRAGRPAPERTVAVAAPPAASAAASARRGFAAPGRVRFGRLDGVVRGGRLQATPLELLGERPPGALPQLDDREQEHGRVQDGDEGDAPVRADRLADPEPVRDVRVHVPVDRREDDVHVEERRERREQVGRPPPPREREQDRREREQRVQVSLVDAGRDDEEGEREHAHADQDRQPVRLARDERRHHHEQEQPEQQPADEGRRERPDLRPRGRVRDRGIRDPQPVARRALAVEREQRPQVVRVDGDVGVRRRGAEHEPQEGRLEERRRARQRDHRQPERRGQHDRRHEPRDGGAEDADGAAGATLPAEARPLGLRLVAVATGRPDRPPDDDERDDGDEDRELRLHQRRRDGEDRGPLRPVLPQLAHGEQQEHRPERVDLPPDDRVEPGDRVDQHDDRREPRAAVGDAEVEDHPVHDIGEDDVGDDRRQLDQVADATRRVADDADEPQRVQVAGRVVGEEAAVVEAVRAFGREVVRPEPEQVQVAVEARSAESFDPVCHDQADDESDEQDRQNRPAEGQPGGLLDRRLPAGRTRTRSGDGGAS